MRWSRMACQMRLRLSLGWTALAELLEPLQLPEGKYGKPNMGEYQLCSLRRRLLVPCARSSLLRLSGQPSPSASRRLCGSPEAYWSACGQSENKLPWASFCSRPCNPSSIVESRAQTAVGVLRRSFFFFVFAVAIQWRKRVVLEAHCLVQFSLAIPS